MKKLLIFAISAVALAGLYVFLLLSLSKVGDRQRDFAGDIKNADKIIREEKANKDAFSGYFLKDGEQAQFVSGIESACAARSLSCDTRSLNETSDPSGAVKTLDIVMSADGSFANITDLLTSFEKSPYPITISKSSLFAKESENPAVAVGWQGVFSLSVPVLISQ